MGFVDVSAGGGYHSMALAADGSIEAWGLDEFGQVSDTPTGTGFLDIAAGYYHSMALAADGSIVSWGYDSYGEVSNTPTGNNFEAVFARGSTNYALRRVDSTPVPEPISVIFFGTGIVGVIGFVARKNMQRNREHLPGIMTGSTRWRPQA